MYILTTKEEAEKDFGQTDDFWDHLHTSSVGYKSLKFLYPHIICGKVHEWNHGKFLQVNYTQNGLHKATNEYYKYILNDDYEEDKKFLFFCESHATEFKDKSATDIIALWKLYKE